MAAHNTEGMAGSSSRTAPLTNISTHARVLFSVTLIIGLLASVLSAVYAQDPQPATDPTVSIATPSATPSAEMPRLELQLEEVNESDISGTVTLFAFGDKTIVDFQVEGAGGDHPATIVPWMCGETEPADADIATPTADAEEKAPFDLEMIDEHGRSLTTVDISLDNLLESDHSIEIRMSEDDIDTIIGCADIEGEPTLEDAASATPTPSPTAIPTQEPTVAPEPTEAPDGVGGTTDDPVDGVGGNSALPSALTVKLVDWSDTGVTGTATLTGDTTSTLVTINIAGPGVIGGHEVHIHNGTCAYPGTATYVLNPIDANGSSVSTINLTLDQLNRGNYFINIHPDEENWDDWMVCGNINGSAVPVSDVPAQGQGGTGSTVSDGSVGGNTTLVTTDAAAGEFPSKVGVGEGLRWPSDARDAAIWGVSALTITMLATGIVIRSGEREHRNARFPRLGL